MIARFTPLAVAACTMAAACTMIGAAGAAAQHSVFDAPQPATVPVVVAPAVLGSTGALIATAPASGLVQERRGRQTWRFARWGALLGGAAGLTVGGLYALYCSGGAYDDCGSVWFGMTALGVASGFVGGAIIGSAIPAPRTAPPPALPSDPADPSASPVPAPPGRLTPHIGSAAINAGLAGASIADEGGSVATGTGPAARIHVHAELLPWLALGPEAGVASFGDAGDIRHIALAGRIRRSGRVAPFGTVNLGAYDSTGPSLEYLGAGAGAGVRMESGTTGRYFLEVEGRHSRNAQNIAPMRMWSVTVSGGLYW